MEKVCRLMMILIIGTPFGYIHCLLNYGLAAAKNATTHSRIRWSPDNKTIYFDGCGLVLENLKVFVEETITLAEKMMSRDLLFQTDGSIPEFDLEMIDDPSNHEAGYYFAHRDSQGWKKTRSRMLNRLRGSKTWDDMVTIDGDGMSFNKAGLDVYEKCDMKFRELLAILIMITCGLSGRGTQDGYSCGSGRIGGFVRHKPNIPWVSTSSCPSPTRYTSGPTHDVVVAKKRAHGPVCILWLKSIKCVAQHLRSFKQFSI